MTERAITGKRQPHSPSEPRARWHRLAPAAVLPLVVRGAVELARQGWQAFAGMAAAVHFTADDRGLLWVWIGLGVAVLLIVGGVLQWWYFRYALDEQAIILRRGVFARQRLHLAFERVQNLRITIPIYLRPFGLVTLALDSAGSQGAEIVLPAVSRALADDIAHRVHRAQKAQACPETEPLPKPKTPGRPGAGSDVLPATESVLIRRTAHDLIRQGLASNTAWVVAGVLTSLFASNPEKTGRMFVALLGTLFGPLNHLSWMAVTGLVAGGLMVTLVAILLLSVLGSLVYFQGFVLVDEGRAWRARYGLLEKREIVIAKTKLQALSLRQTLIGRLIGVWELRFHQVGGFRQNPGQGMARQQKLVIPAVTNSELADILAAIMPGIPWPLPAVRRPHPFLITHGMRYLSLLAVGTGMGLAAVLIQETAGAVGWALAAGIGLVAVTTGLGYLVVSRIRREHGYAMVADLVVTVRGFLGRRIVLFRPFKIQWVRIRSGPALRRRQLANLTVALAGLRTEIVYLPAKDAQGLAAGLVHQAAQDPRPWY